MEDQELMAFINRILANDSLFKGPRVLSELERILAEQGAPLRPCDRPGTGASARQAGGRACEPGEVLR